jgi:trimethylamine---corrinoid protein Co-methyltransferase
MSQGYSTEIKNRYRVLSTEDIRKIKQSTLEALESTGITVMHTKGLEVLAEAGATIDWEAQRAKIPARVVEKCLSTAPKQFVLAGRDPQKDLVINSGKIYGRNGGGPGHVEDIHTGQVHEASMADVHDYARMVDALPNIQIVAPIYAQDVPSATRDIRVLATILNSTSKHINMRLLQLASLPYVLEMAEIAAGSRENLSARPIITMLESPITPLKLPDVLIETLWACGERGIPVEICSMPIAGATGPITLAGSLLMSNIEMVASIVISQLVHPGAPLIFTPRIMVMDMANGHALTGSIENALLAAAGVQLAQEGYGLPVNMHGPYTDSITSDVQAGMENTYFTFLPALAGASILTGAGHLEGGLFVSYTQLILDHELMGMVQAAIQGFDVDENTLALDVIARSVHTSSLLTDEHTLANLRKVRIFRSKLLSRQPRQNWLDAGSKTMDQVAREKAINLLQTHEPAPLDASIQKALGEVINAAAAKLE